LQVPTMISSNLNNNKINVNLNNLMWYY